MEVQSLLFHRDAGWTVDKAKAWAKEHGYKRGDVDVTAQYVRLRQFSPKGLKVKRTITLGRGIRAVVAREENMARTSTARRTTTKKAAPKKKKSTKRTTRAREQWRGDSAGHSKAAKKGWATRRRHATEEARRRRGKSSHVMEEAPKKKRKPAKKRTSTTKESWSGQSKRHSQAAKKGWATRRAHSRKPKKRTTRAREQWYGDSSGHSKAAKKGWEHRRRSPRTREQWRGDSAGHSKAAKKGWETRRRHMGEQWRGDAAGHSKAAKKGWETRRRHGTAEAPRKRRSYAREAARSTSSGMDGAQLAVAIVSAGVGFVLADGLDRFLATYDPAKGFTTPPKDKFTSDGAGTLANTLNVASTPSIARIGAGVGLTALPAVASMYVEGPMIKSGLQGAAFGTGINLFKMFWNNFLMPMLKPKDTSAAGLQKSYIARLYPAEVAAAINREAKQSAVSAGGQAGALSGPPAQPAQPTQPQAGVSAPPDVGPFALSAESPYPDAAQALRREAGMGANATPGGDFPTLQNVWGTGGSDFPTATQAMAEATGTTGAPAAAGNPGQPGVSAWQPGPPPLPGPGPQAAPGEDPACGCVGDDNPFLGFIGDEAPDDTLFSTTL